MPTTLTERYIAATIRSLPPSAQDDVRAELEASIADAVEARVEQGESPADAERAVLSGLGDPAVLAAGYADRPLHLIGPRYYLVWWRLLRLLLWIVTPLAMGAVLLARLLTDATAGEAIAASVTTGIGVIVHIAFWTTLVFVLLERRGAETGVTWDIDRLPEPPQNASGRTDLIGSLVFLAIAAGAVLWDAVRGFVRVDGEAMPILDPALWPWGVTALLVLLVAEAALAVRVYLAGRWTVPLAVVNTVLAVAFAVPVMVLLLQGRIVNPEFVRYLVESGAEDAGASAGGIVATVAVIVGVVIVGGALWDIVDGWRKALSARSPAPAAPRREAVPN
ncbi:permease prefix domain 1-containing protein [Microbacterium neungamense]|uniref:permease prefix domain 1-containing protein n=1 Tax=Microbacterium neungamense TaxID=2810535 RepID=UPI00217EF939|nr:permease prefix domain 1-containing protein [Microbacterium neungamense]UWF77842.1 hypothetical protein JSY13_01885 [Microbacterium neungamense]